ncbi:esterase-like activity of phytase family protein [Methylolobus aquaticus]
MKTISALLLVAAVTVTPLMSAQAAVTFIGEGSIPGDAVDQSKLDRTLEDGASPHNRVGGLGSAITYSGNGNSYLALPDRGPAGGKTSYFNRLYRIDIKLAKVAENRYTVEPVLTSTLLLRTEDGRQFTGHAGTFDAINSPDGLRLDPEGLRVSGCGHTALICDEYGPHIYEVDLKSGKRIRNLPVPRKFLVDFPSANPDDEKNKNLTGRQPNRGFEGLAITPDGARLLAVIQQPLLQDGALGTDRKPVGVNCRILEVDLQNGAVREYMYVMERPANGLSEILAINDHEFLIIEHDSKPAAETTFKSIFRVDLNGATDVRSIAALPSTGTTVSDGGGTNQVTPVAKTLFVDLLRAGIPDMPEKVEGLTFGPDLADGRHLLIASADNDFERERASRFLAFAVDPGDLPRYQPLPRAGAGPNHACSTPLNRVASGQPAHGKERGSHAAHTKLTRLGSN